jgi:hypothetical protein
MTGAIGGTGRTATSDAIDQIDSSVAIGPIVTIGRGTPGGRRPASDRPRRAVRRIASRTPACRSASIRVGSAH